MRAMTTYSTLVTSVPMPSAQTKRVTVTASMLSTSAAAASANPAIRLPSASVRAEPSRFRTGTATQAASDDAERLRRRAEPDRRPGEAALLKPEIEELDRVAAAETGEEHDAIEAEDRRPARRGCVAGALARAVQDLDALRQHPPGPLARSRAGRVLGHHL